jgi:hypothetical protein
MGEMNNVYKIAIGKPQEKKRFEIPIHRWEDMKMYFTRQCVKWWT